MYLNDGSGNFSLVYNTPFVGVQDGSVEFLDANGNGSQDVIIIGRDKFLNRTATLYLNDGLGNFTIDSTASFAALSNDAIDIADVNGDGLEDVLVSGRTAFTERVVKLYVNDGSGNFVEVPNTPFPKISDGTVKFADVNGDGIQDVLLIGQDSTGTVITKLYTNNLDPSTSLPDLSPQDQFSFQLQPNPAEAQTVSINYRAPKAQRVHIHIHDLQGKLVHSTESILPVGEQEFPLDISNLRSGLYFVTASDGENQATQKLMIR
ncbi:MAG: T9SS type A sorting domain-containing protein [Bacteroidota bacterium]